MEPAFSFYSTLISMEVRWHWEVLVETVSVQSVLERPIEWICEKLLQINGAKSKRVIEVKRMKLHILGQ